MPSVLESPHARTGHWPVSILQIVQVVDATALHILDQPQEHKLPSGGAASADWSHPTCGWLSMCFIQQQGTPSLMG